MAKGFWSCPRQCEAEAQDVESLLFRALRRGDDMERQLSAVHSMWAARFRASLKAVNSLRKPEWRRFDDGGMHTARAVHEAEKAMKKEIRLLFNLGVPGIGKTRTVFAISKHLGFRNVLVLATKSTVDSLTSRGVRQWVSHAGIVGEREAELRVLRRTSSGSDPARTNYVFVTEYQVQDDRDGVVGALSAVPFDMVVIDELQSWTGSKEASDTEEGLANRKRNLAALVGRMPAECLFYPMTATPVRVSLDEAYGILELICGLPSKPSSHEPLDLRFELLSYGFRDYIDPRLLPRRKEADLLGDGRVRFECSADAETVGGRIVAAYVPVGDSPGLNMGRPGPAQEEHVIGEYLGAIEAHEGLSRLLREASCPIFYTNFVDGAVGPAGEVGA